jgi:4-carboxymuconolactone decarboxylase
MTDRKAGIDVVREMMGDQSAAKLEASAGSNAFGAVIAAYAVDQVFADIWTRPSLDRRSHCLVSMAVMIAMRQPHEFAIHMGPGSRTVVP